MSNPFNIFECKIVIKTLFYRKVYSMDVAGPIPDELWNLTFLFNLYGFLCPFSLLLLLSFFCNVKLVFVKWQKIYVHFPFVAEIWPRITWRVLFLHPSAISLACNTCKSTQNRRFYLTRKCIYVLLKSSYILFTFLVLFFWLLPGVLV